MRRNELVADTQRNQVEKKIIYRQNETITLAKEIISELEIQGEKLERVNIKLEETNVSVDKSKHTLETMTWWGWTKSFFTSPPSSLQPRQSKETSKETSIEENSSFRRSPKVIPHSNTIPSSQVESNEPNQLDEMLKNVGVLKEAARTIGTTLEKQESVINNVDSTVSTAQLKVSANHQRIGKLL